MHHRRDHGAFDAVNSACTLTVLLLCACVGLSLLQAWRGSSDLCIRPSLWSALLGLLLLAACLLSLGASVRRAVAKGRWLGAPREQGALALALAFLFLVSAVLLLRSSLG